MKNVFERYEITHLSQSSINLFLTNIPLFIVRYLHKIKDPTNSKMLRGTVSDMFICRSLGFEKTEDEEGKTKWTKTKEKLSEEDLGDRAEKYFKTAMQDLEDDGGFINEMCMVKGYVKAGSDFYKKKKVISVQKKIELDFEIDIPVIGYCDLEMSKEVRDIKTTNRTPSKLPDQVSRQIAVYATALNKPRAYADYIVGNQRGYNIRTFECDDLNMRIDEIYRICMAMQNLLGNNDIKSLVEQFYPDFSDWQWSPKTIESARKIWSIK